MWTPVTGTNWVLQEAQISPTKLAEIPPAGRIPSFKPTIADEFYRLFKPPPDGASIASYAFARERRDSKKQNTRILPRSAVTPSF
jgi:hypothetical protein